MGAPSKTLQGALIDIQILSNVAGPITKADQVERLSHIYEIAERAIKENARQAVESVGTG
jgi:hypothetical protein